MRSLVVILLLSIDYGEPVAALSQTLAGVACVLPQATVLRREGNAAMHVWELPAGSVWLSETTPDVPGYRAYRSAVRAAGADDAKAVLHLALPKDEAEREIVRNEEYNCAGASDVMFPPKNFYGFAEVAGDAAEGSIPRPRLIKITPIGRAGEDR